MINRERLIRLRNFIRRVPKKHFDMAWFRNGTAKDLQVIGKTLKPLDCGSTACALGWLPAIWPEQFFWNDNSFVESTDGRYLNAVVSEFFGITHDQRHLLFYTADDYKSKAEFVRKVNSLL